jgi:hypothetical protein
MSTNGKTPDSRRGQEFDDTLTQEEKAAPTYLDAPTYLEWSDETLARGVRDLAKSLKDEFGARGTHGIAAAHVLAGMLGENEAGKIEIILDKKIRVTVEEC